MKVIKLVNLEITYKRLLNGDCRISETEKNYMNVLVNDVLTKKFIDPYDEKDILTIIKISNVLYNNAANIMLPLNDDLYDRILVMCRHQSIAYPVGAPPVVFKNLATVDRLEAHTEGIKQVVAVVKDKDKMMYFHNLTTDLTPPCYGDYAVSTDDTMIERKIRNTKHDYNMCGTLDKCKFVLNIDAKNVGAYNDPTVDIFERDFIQKYIHAGVIDQNNINMIMSIKYDGISVEATVCGDEIVSACTRGDTSNNEASDLTPALSGLKFPRASGVDKNETIGIKFEFIITKENMQRLSAEYGKNYVNARNAVIGLLGGLDARKFRDYLTPIPLESTINAPREVELEFLNKYYTKGIDMRWVPIHGNYETALYEVKQFTMEADNLRGYMNFQYDGVVAEFTDPAIIQRLGKKNSIPNYSVAIKFPPMKRQSTFTGYTFSIGQSGVIIPMAHFEPVEFMGATHNKTTVHSLKRFNNLALKIGDLVDLTLVNDVIVYLTKAPDDIQPENNNDYEQFLSYCPACGSSLYVSDSGDNAYCINFDCPERVISRISNMLAKLNIKDFASESIRALNINSLYDLITYPRDKAIEILGKVEGSKFCDRMDQLKNTEYPDYRLVGSIGFTGIGSETWRLILERFPLEKIVNGSDADLGYLNNIKGIGRKTVSTIIKERPKLLNDLKVIFYNLHHKDSYSESGPIEQRMQVRFTGFRDKNLEQLFNAKGFDANGEGSVTNSTSILIVPYLGYESSSTKKAFSILSKKVKALDPANAQYIGYNNLIIARNLSPWILTPDQANEYIRNFNKV
jgi:DNA ligase (NAD+)